jgi:hypothetical protein
MRHGERHPILQTAKQETGLLPRPFGERRRLDFAGVLISPASQAMVSCSSWRIYIILEQSR